MKLRYVGIIAAALVLSGCTSADWDRATLFSSSASEDADAPTTAPVLDASPAPTPRPTPQASGAETFCKGYAEDQARIKGDMGIGQKEQVRVAEFSFRDCMAGSSHWNG